MSCLTRTGALVLVVSGLFQPAAVAADDLRDSLRLQEIAGIRIDLNPWGARLGFETEVAGGDSRVEVLAAVIRAAEPAGDHKCANSGAIRFRMEDGRVIGVGLLRSHDAGSYDLRLYDGTRYVASYCVPRAALVAALEALGVPAEDPALGE